MLNPVQLQKFDHVMAQLAQPILPRHTGRLVASDGILLEASGFPYPIGMQAQISAQGSDPTLVELIGFRGARAQLARLSGPHTLTIGAAVIPRHCTSDVACGDAFLGRFIGALGQPLDEHPLPAVHDSWPLAGTPLPPLSRASVSQPFDCGVRAINALLTLGVGQRAAIIAGSGVGKSVLMGQILAGAIAPHASAQGSVDRIVIGLIGERGREIRDFLDKCLPPDVRSKTVVVASPADEPALLRLRAAHRATAIAEHFRSQGHHVLLLIDSLTRVAHAQREIGLALGEPPAMKAYPPSVFAAIPALVERAGCDANSGGAITALYTVLADGDDVQDPVVDAVRAIVDGHIVLSRTLAEAQVYPAIDIGQSISRVMHDIVSDAHASSAAQFRAAWSCYAENRDLVLMGAWQAGVDATLDAAISARPAMLDFMRQSPKDISALADSVSELQRNFQPQSQTMRA